MQRTTLEDLAESLRLGGQASADVDGLTTQRKEAMALQNAAMPEINKYGTVSPLAVMAQMVGASRGRQDMRGVDAGLAKAKAAMNQAATDKTMYGANVAADAVSYGKEQDTAKASALVKSAALANTNRENAADTKNRNAQLAAVAANAMKMDNDAVLADAKLAEMGDPETWVNDAGDEQVVYHTNDGSFNFNPETQERQRANLTGYRARPKITRSSGSTFQSVKTKDQYGNDVLSVFDKSTGTLEPSQFATGEPWEATLAEKRAGQQVSHAGSTTRAKEGAKIDQKAAEDAYAKTFAIRGSLNQLDKGIAALAAGANTGWLANKLPYVRKEAVQLKNARDQLALYEIGKYSFGALSEAEGTWLKDVVVPLDMDEDDLLPWMQKKREGMSRMLRVKEMEQEMREAGFTPTQQEIDNVLYSNGFTFSDDSGSL